MGMLDLGSLGVLFFFFSFLRRCYGVIAQDDPNKGLEDLVEHT